MIVAPAACGARELPVPLAVTEGARTVITAEGWAAIALFVAKKTMSATKMLTARLISIPFAGFDLLISTTAIDP
jgi:hypothetical protein